MSNPGSIERVNNFWHSRSKSDTVVVFVHGIFSTSRTCWLRNNGPDSPPTFWPDLVRDDPRLGNPSIFLAGYHTALDAGDFATAQCADQVFDALQRPDEDGLPPPLDARRIIFVCHSTGGIVVRYMLDFYLDRFADKAVGLALIASPSVGSGWANLASLAAKFYNQQLGQQLRWNDSLLNDVHRRFRRLVDNREALMPGLFGMEAAEGRMILLDRLPRVVRAVLSRMRVVSTLSAGQYFGPVKTLPETDHFSAVKPDSKIHPSHDFLVDFLAEFNRRELARIRRSPAGHPLETSAPPETEQAPAPGRSDEWPGQKLDATFAFLAETGFDSSGGTRVISYVSVEDINSLENRFTAGLTALSQDPYFRAKPALVAAIRTRQFDYGTADPDLQGKIVELLSRLTFEAHVCFSRSAKSSGDRLHEQMLGSVLFQRLRGIGNLPVNLVLSPSMANRGNVRPLLSATVLQIKRTDDRDISAHLLAGNASDTGCLFADYVAQIVRRRLDAPDSREARAFERIHPAKLRLLQDFDSGQFFSRRRRFESAGV